MEKKELEPVESSSLPLSSADSQPPLVVDLPDGQKLVVGNLDPGTVVEVATWRGTGRPDSRTNRLMLGVSSADENSPKQVSAPQFVQSEPAAITATASQVRTGIIYSELNPTSSRSELAQITDAKPARNIWKSAAKIIVPISVLGLFIAVLVGPLGMRVAHPQDGVGTSLGSASSTLIVTRPITRITIGKNVVADLKALKKNPAIGVISAVSGENILVATKKGYYQVEPRDVRGSVFIVLPFIGKIFDLFS